MSSARSLFSKPFFLAVGLTMVLAGVASLTVGYLGGHDATSRAAGEAKIVVQAVKPASPTTRKSTASAKKKTRATVARKTGTPPVKATVAARKRKSTRPMAAPETVAPVVSTLPAKPASKWRRMIWWGGSALAVGLASVAYSLHEMRPKRPTTGAEELLKEKDPF